MNTQMPTVCDTRFQNVTAQRRLPVHGTAWNVLMCYTNPQQKPHQTREEQPQVLHYIEAYFKAAPQPQPSSRVRSARAGQAHGTGTTALGWERLPQRDQKGNKSLHRTLLQLLLHFLRKNRFLFAKQPAPVKGTIFWRLLVWVLFVPPAMFGKHLRPPT